MRVIETIADLRAALPPGEPVCLVPTMGNLHEGHLSLIRAARARIDGERSGLVVASIFVNPMQFGPQDDFVKYPRTLRRDCELLSGGGCDIVFAPGPLEIYPVAQEYRVQPPTDLADILEGAVRPGFFTGVCTVVLKLFNIVQPRWAVFGKKDYQQVLVIRGMVRQCDLPVEVVAADTVRESDGLALSSRNGYLSGAERIEAAHLHQAVGRVAAAVRSGRTDYPVLEAGAMQALATRGWAVDYCSIRRRSDLGMPLEQQPLVVVAAATLGTTRLIDNNEV